MQAAKISHQADTIAELESITAMLSAKMEEKSRVAEAFRLASTEREKELTALIRDHTARVSALEGANTVLEEAVDTLHEQASASIQRIQSLVDDKAFLTNELVEERRAEEAFRQASNERERELASEMESLQADKDKLAGDVAHCRAFSEAHQRESEQQLADAAERHKSCVNDMAGLKKSHEAQLLDALERETVVTATATTLKEEVHATAEGLSNCRQREDSLQKDMATREAAWKARSGELEASLRDERKNTAVALKRAKDAEGAENVSAALIAQHEGLAASLRLHIGKMTSEVGVAERQAKALSEEAKTAKQEVCAAVICKGGEGFVK